MIEIKLTQGKVALVDDIDSDLAAYKWCAHYIHSNNWYAERRFNKKMHYLHRIILKRMFGGDIPAGVMCDHINHDGLDNRRSNLRPVTARENQWNKRENSTWKSSIYKGVHKLPDGKWTARVRSGEDVLLLGTFDNEIEAAKAYDECVKSIRGEYAYTNF